ncbi:unnamed protein product [Medioppia subpectinata]|uniref:Fatty acid synthase n=1 Tax=Medioppia subpectinata TaxID=1979941 RepID=A0A7R9KF99_9ACAR|nr:unnamed protein product [Medioppia subpectinata]CAG2101507.1 unnamed protein product [Medioppia subpectinata]
MGCKPRDIVISGMSGRFPMSDTIDEFARNLYEGRDLVTDDHNRWPKDLFGVNSRMGAIESCDRFDAAFFGQLGADLMDPQIRMLLEVVYEAIVDAVMLLVIQFESLQPQQLRGTNTGVYFGGTNGNSGLPDDAYPDLTNSVNATLNKVLGHKNFMFANRISFVYDFHGPSISCDTACSSSLSTLALAYNDMLLGHVDNAIVCASNVWLEPIIYQCQQVQGVCSPRGVSAPFDSGADGYVKSDAVCAVLLQRRPDARRVYGTVRAVRLNVDGAKKDGMYQPSSDAQESLMRRTYADAGIDPSELSLVELHSAGTQVRADTTNAGDFREVNAVYNAYCKPTARTEQLPIRSLKSNMGHAEGASGLAALIKVLIAYENECIPPNINLGTLHAEIAPLVPPLLPVVKSHYYKPGLAAVNSFGVGGANAHVLLEPNYKLATSNGHQNVADIMPRIVNICGRSEESMIVLTDKTRRPLWVLFPGLGGQWSAMAKALMPIKTFADTIEECHQILDKEFGIDLKHILLSEDKTAISTMTAKFVATTAIEIALFAVIKDLDITPDGIIGHSFGEIACAFADGCLDVRGAMFYTALRAINSVQNADIPKGLMVVVGLSRTQALQYCPNGVYIACNNGKENVVITGPMKHMLEIIKQLKAKGVFVRPLDCDEIPYHSPYISESAKAMKEAINTYAPNHKLRSGKWLSTSVFRSEPEDKRLEYLNGDYFEYNMVNEVRFHDQFQTLPADAIVLELGPHSVFKQIVSETLPKSTYISLIKKDSNATNMDMFLSGLAQLYELGFNLAIDRLYPPVEWPVARNTPSISSLIKWDHSKQYYVNNYHDTYCKANASDTLFTISHKLNEDKFYMDHVVQGKAIVPATGHLMMAWRKAAASVGKLWSECPVVFEKVHFKRAVLLSDNADTCLRIRYNVLTGDLSIRENDDLCVTCRVRPVPSGTDDYGTDGSVLSAQDSISDWRPLVDGRRHTIQRSDIYASVHAIGIEHKSAFQRLDSISTDDFCTFYGRCEWTGNPVTYLDGLMLATGLHWPVRAATVPVIINRLRVDPRILLAAVRAERSDGQSAVTTDGNHAQHVECFMNLSDHDNNSVTRFNEKFAKFSAHLPFRYDADTGFLVTPGIEIERTSGQILGTRFDTNLTLDSYDFCANNDMTAIDVSARAEMLHYIEVCKAMAVKIRQLGVNELKCDFNYKYIDENAIQEYKNANNKNHFSDKYGDRLKGWDPSTGALCLTPSHLVIMRDSQDLWPLDLNAFIQDLYDSIENNGFLLTAFRYKFTEPEIIISVNKPNNDCNNVWLMGNEGTINGQSDDMLNLQLFDARKVPQIDYHFNNKMDFTMVNVYFSGLSFIDVMMVTDRIPTGMNTLFTDCLLGSEYVGRRADTGERVMGMALNRCLATSVYAPITHMTPIPDHWSMAEAATIMSAYCTVYYALIKRANLSKGESVLIHSGAGGVGQAAINVCQHYGCDIYVTVGTAEKRQYLRQKYNIPDERIFSSRDTRFLGAVMKSTGGRGVDIVLNSLTGQKSDMSYDCVADSGRFIELGKYDLVQNRPLDRFEFLRDIQYIGVSLDIVLRSATFLPDYYAWVSENSVPDMGVNGNNRCCVRPLNYTSFPAAKATEAFGYMTTGQHIGKVIVQFRDEESDKRPLVRIKPAPTLLVSVKTYFNPKKTYIITGGLGGIGLELLPWMHYRGARKFVITSRRGLTTDYQKFFINRMFEFYSNTRYFESKIIISTANGLTIEGTKQLLREAQELGPIGGVFHLALVLNENLFENMPIEKFAETVDTKQRVFENLDQLTRGLDYKVDYFVVFSSQSCGNGFTGVSNYAYGNSVCERLCERRRRDGVHGLAVQYGMIGDVGAFEGHDGYELHTLSRRQRIISACDVLDRLLALPNAIVTSQLFDKQMSSQTNDKTGNRLMGELWSVMGVDPNTTPDVITLGEIGLESLFAIQLQNEFRDRLDMNVPLAHIKGLTVGMCRAYGEGDPEPVRQYLIGRKSAHSSVQRHLFVIPAEKYVRLNGAPGGGDGRNPVFFMPTLNMSFALMDDLCRRLDRPAYGLNWTRECSQLATVAEVADYYRKLIGEIMGAQSGSCGRYDLVGYFDITPACVEIMMSAGHVAGAPTADRVVIVEPDGLLNFGEQIMDDFVIECMLSQLATDAPIAVMNAILGRVRAEPDLKAKIVIVMAHMHELTHERVVAPDMAHVFGVMLARIRMFFEHRVHKRRPISQTLSASVAEKWAQISGKLIIIKQSVVGAPANYQDAIQLALGTNAPEYKQAATGTICVENIEQPSPLTTITNAILDKVYQALK